LLINGPKVDAAAGTVADDANECQEKQDTGAAGVAKIRTSFAGVTNVPSNSNPSPYAVNRDLCKDTLQMTNTYPNPCISLFGGNAVLISTVNATITTDVESLINLLATKGNVSRDPDMMRQKACDEALPQTATGILLFTPYIYYSTPH